MKTTLTKGLLGLSILMVSGMALAEDKLCKDNFVAGGNERIGRSFQTNDFVEGGKVAPALKALERTLKMKGYTVKRIDRSNGIIYATNPVNNNPNKVMPINVGVSQKPNGIRIDVSATTGPGLKLYQKDAMNEFCAFVDAVRN